MFLNIFSISNEKIVFHSVKVYFISFIYFTTQNIEK